MGVYLSRPQHPPNHSQHWSGGAGGPAKRKHLIFKMGVYLSRPGIYIYNPQIRLLNYLLLNYFSWNVAWAVPSLLTSPFSLLNYVLLNLFWSEWAPSLFTNPSLGMVLKILQNNSIIRFVGYIWIHTYINASRKSNTCLPMKSQCLQTSQKVNVFRNFIFW